MIFCPVCKTMPGRTDSCACRMLSISENFSPGTWFFHCAGGHVLMLSPEPDGERILYADFPFIDGHPNPCPCPEDMREDFVRKEIAHAIDWRAMVTVLTS